MSTADSMFVVNLFYERMRTSLEDEGLWEETFTLVRALTKEEALTVAQRLAKRHEVSFETLSGTTSDWVYRGVGDAYEIINGGLEHGVELFARFLRPSEAKSLMTPFDDDS